MLLSICILTCDKDVDLLPDFIRRIEERVKNEHEVLVWDNTEKKTIPPLPANIVIGTTGEKRNWFQFVGRRELVRMARGEYIWFVDPDDDIGEIPADAETMGADLVVFCIMQDGEMVHYNDEAFDTWQIQAPVQFIDWHNMFSIGDALWSHWYSTTALLETYTQLGDTSPCISIHEDTLLNAAFLRNTRTCYCSNIKAYNYCTRYSLAANSVVIKNGGDFARYCTGFDTFLGMMNNLYTTTELAEIYKPYSDFMEHWYGSSLVEKLCNSIMAHPDMLEGFMDAISKELHEGELVSLVSEYRVNLTLEQLTNWVPLEIKIRKWLQLRSDMRVTICLHPDCNLACPYCNRKENMKSEPRLTDSQMAKNFAHVLEQLGKLLPYGFVPQIMGGEPACWSLEFDKMIANLLEPFNHYIVFTNGTDRQSFWYKQPHAQTLTHVTDWRDTMTDYVPVTERDSPVIVVTHQDLPYLEDYLKINTNKDLQIAPCDSAGEEWDITEEDAKKILCLQDKYALCFKGHVGVDMDIDDGQKCDIYLNPRWQVDCATLMAAVCTKSRNWVPFDELTQDTKLTCKGCVLTAF